MFAVAAIPIAYEMPESGVQAEPIIAPRLQLTGCHYLAQSVIRSMAVST
jgi:hypothetical protein